MKIGSIDFPRRAFASAGALGFFGEKYRIDRLPPWRWADWRGATLTTKTTTFAPRHGNMPMRQDGVTTRELFPRCIIVKPFGGHVLNAVGLSGPGAVALVESGRWQAWPEPFVISFMAVGDDRNMRMQEWLEFLALLAGAKKTFRSPFAVEINIACPNVGHDASELLNEVGQMLDLGGRLRVPLLVNINLLVSPKTAAEISRHENCAAVVQSNSIPWGAFPDRIPWKKIFGSDASPLLARGFKSPGGYSGPYARPILVNWLVKAHDARPQGTPWLIAGCGIQSVEDAREVSIAGFPIVLGYKLGVIGKVRPWNVQPVIRYLNAAHRSP